jgi:hypothetical protein
VHHLSDYSDKYDLVIALFDFHFFLCFLFGGAGGCTQGFTLEPCPQPSFSFLVRDSYIAQAGLELLGSNNTPVSASQEAGATRYITMPSCLWLHYFLDNPIKILPGLLVYGLPQTVSKPQTRTGHVVQVVESMSSK